MADADVSESDSSSMYVQSINDRIESCNILHDT